MLSQIQVNLSETPGLRLDIAVASGAVRSRATLAVVVMVSVLIQKDATEGH